MKLWLIHFGFSNPGAEVVLADPIRGLKAGWQFVPHSVKT
jgi:hypothetical protein